MPSKKKNAQGPDMVKNLKPKGQPASRAEDVKGGRGTLGVVAGRLEPLATTDSTLSNILKTSSDTQTAITSNLK